VVATDAGPLQRRARAVALMHGSGALLTAVAILTPGAVPPGLPRGGYLAIAAACFGTAVLALLRRDRFGMAAVGLALLTGDLAIAAATMVANQRPGGSSTLLLLLWPTLLAAIFLSRRLVRMQVGAVAVVGALVFHRAPAGLGVALIQVLVMTVSLAVAAKVVLQLRERLTAAVQEADRLSRTDPLTGLANRRGLEDRLPGMWAAASRQQAALAVLLLDVDHFKAINDDHGHAVGDRVLVELADVVGGLVRAEDVVARFGGEELVVVAAEAAPAGSVDVTSTAAEMGERLRLAVAAARLSVPVTVSVGAVARVPVTVERPLVEFAAMLDQADRAMYAAKRSGRNRVVTATAAAVPAPVSPGVTV
jgi:diguanylate cyclase (GGDEF)-like protein